MRKRLRYQLLTLFAILGAFASEARAYEYPVSSIADSLKENAVAVIREYSTMYTQTDLYNGTYKVKKVITILNSQGNGHAHFYSYRDQFIDFRKFEGVIRSGDGKEIKKIRWGDLIESNISSQMATDNFSITYEVSSPVYPYTVEYTYEQRYKNGICAYPRFMPITKIGESVEKATYIIQLPRNIDIRYKSGFDCKIEEQNTDKHRIYTLSSGPIKAIRAEALSVHYRERMPTVKIAPNDFSFDGVSGNMSDWKNYGLWVNKLLDGRDVLSPAATEQIKALCKDMTDKREIVKTLYEHMQANSRYVNISLGIGGLQPIGAESVLKNKYGDCKGLSNVMKAMLKAVDIPSYYCEIHLGTIKHLDKDFFDMMQTNHAILMVPLASDTIWLECTSQTVPFGYIHDDIEGHDALAMTENGGVLCRLPSYTSGDNMTETNVAMTITEDGNISGNMHFVEHLHGFGNNHYTMKSNDRVKHVSYINKRINFPKIDIGEIKTSEIRSENPQCMLRADFSAKDVIRKTGSRMFIPILPLKKNSFDVFRSKTRDSDIEINYGYSEKDSITIYLPPNMVIETMPKPVNMITPFGIVFAETIKKNESTIVYKQYINVFSGRYDKSQYDAFRKFFAQISSTIKQNIVVRKEDK